MNQKNQFGGLFMLALGAALLFAIMTADRSDANQAASAEKTSVAVVDLERTFNGLEEWFAVESRLVEMSEAIESEAAKRRDQVGGLEADTQDYPIGSENFKEAQRKYELAALEFKAYVQLYTSQRVEFNDLEILRIYDKIKSSAQAMADERGYDLILVDDSVVPIPAQTKDILGQISSRRVLFARQQLDVTDALITEMNSSYRAGGS